MPYYQLALGPANRALLPTVPYYQRRLGTWQPGCQPSLTTMGPVRWCFTTLGPVDLPSLYTLGPAEPAFLPFTFLPFTFLPAEPFDPLTCLLYYQPSLCTFQPAEPLDQGARLCTLHLSTIHHSTKELAFVPFYHSPFYLPSLSTLVLAFVPYHSPSLCTFQPAEPLDQGARLCTLPFTILPRSSPLYHSTCRAFRSTYLPTVLPGALRPADLAIIPGSAFASPLDLEVSTSSLFYQFAFLPARLYTRSSRPRDYTRPLDLELSTSRPFYLRLATSVPFYLRLAFGPWAFDQHAFLPARLTTSVPFYLRLSTCSPYDQRTCRPGATSSPYDQLPASLSTCSPYDLPSLYTWCLTTSGPFYQLAFLPTEPFYLRP